MGQASREWWREYEQRPHVRAYRKAYKQRPEAKAAHKARKLAHRREVREWLNAYKVRVGCVDCGYNASAVALDFDHRDPTTKSFELGAAGRNYRTRAVLETEVAKCDVRCANCHRIRTAERRIEAAS